AQSRHCIAVLKIRDLNVVLNHRFECSNFGFDLCFFLTRSSDLALIAVEHGKVGGEEESHCVCEAGCTLLTPVLPADCVMHFTLCKLQLQLGLRSDLIASLVQQIR